MRTGILSVIFLLFCPALGMGQEKSFLYVSSLKNAEGWSFPLVQGRKQDNGSIFINKTLQLLELTCLVNNTKDTGAYDWTAYSPERGRNGGITYIHYDVKENSPSVFSVSIQKMLQGATQYLVNSYYNFEPVRGAWIHPLDLFTVSGLDSFLAYSTPFRFRQLNNTVASLGTSYDMSETEALLKSDREFPFFIKNDSLFIDDVHYLHRTLVLMLGQVVTGFPLNRLESLLSPAGKALDSGREGALIPYTGKTLPQLFEGTAGTRPVLAVFPEPASTGIQAAIAWQDSSKGYLYYGSEKDGGYLLESDYHSQPGAPVINAQINKEKTEITGVLTGPQGRLPLKLRKAGTRKKE